MGASAGARSEGVLGARPLRSLGDYEADARNHTCERYWPSAWLASRENDEFPGCPPVFHVGVRLGDLVERVGAVDRDGEAARGDRVQVGLQRAGWEVGGVAAVRREPDAGRDVVDRVEVGDGPLVAQHAGEAHDAVDGGGAKGVAKRVGADELERGVDAVWRDRSRLRRNVTVVDEDVVDADRL